MFVNKHVIRAVVSPENLRARDHAPVLLKDEENVRLPCFFLRSSKVVREAGAMNTVQLDAEMQIDETDETSRLIVRGALIRFEHRPKEYYKIFDITFEEGIFGGAGQQMDVRLIRYKGGVRPTHKRTELEDSSTVIVPTEKSEIDPTDDIQIDNDERWGR